MYNDRSRMGYRTYILRKRLIFSAVVLAIIGLITTMSIRAVGKFAGTVRVERKEFLRLWESGSYDEVFNRSQAALASHPIDYFLLTMNGFSAYQLGISQINNLDAGRYFDDSVGSLRKAVLLKEGVNDGRLYYVLGKAYSYKGESYADLSVKYLRKARLLSYSAADIPEYLGLAYASIGDYRNSIAAFSDALGPAAAFEFLGREEDGPSGLLLLSIAQSYLALDEFEMARTYLQHCIDVSPDSRTILSARLLLAETLRKIGDNDGAKKQLLEIIAETGGDAEAHYQLGELYALQGETISARSEWRQALRADPAHKKARTRLSL
jgi:tetratricopeptide (TPR) repeat protein